MKTERQVRMRQALDLFYRIDLLLLDAEELQVVEMPPALARNLRIYRKSLIEWLALESGVSSTGQLERGSN